MKPYQARQYCSGCYNDFYNDGGVDGNCKQCMQLKTAKIVWCKVISTDVRVCDYHRYPKVRRPSCYRKQRYVTLHSDDRYYRAKKGD